jgi:hypothetical protein
MLPRCLPTFWKMSSRTWLFWIDTCVCIYCVVYTERHSGAKKIWEHLLTIHVVRCNSRFLLINFSIKSPPKKNYSFCRGTIFQNSFFFWEVKKDILIICLLHAACKRRAVLCRWFRNKHRLYVREIERGREGGESERVVCVRVAPHERTHVHTYIPHACVYGCSSAHTTCLGHHLRHRRRKAVCRWPHTIPPSRISVECTKGQNTTHFSK